MSEVLSEAELQVKLCSARYDERERADQAAHEIMDAFKSLQRRVEELEKECIALSNTIDDVAGQAPGYPY